LALSSPPYWPPRPSPKTSAPPTCRNSADSSAALTTLASPAKEQVEEHKKAAEEAQRAGDVETCGAEAEKALQLLQKPGGDGGAETN